MANIGTSVDVSRLRFAGTVGGRWEVSENFDGNPSVVLIEPRWSVGRTFIVEESGQQSAEDIAAIAKVPALLSFLLRTIAHSQNTDEPIPVSLQDEGLSIINELVAEGALVSHE